MKLLVLCNDRLALPALNQLIQSRLVSGIGMTERESEVQLIVRNIAGQHAVPITYFQKKTFNGDLHAWLREHNPDAVLVKTFPWKVPAGLLDVPRFGFINFHYAPLPQWSGPNPLFWMIRNRVQEAGVTVHRMEAEVDKGPVILQKKFPVSPGVTFGMLSSQLAYTGLELTGELLDAMTKNTLNYAPQDHSLSGWHKRPSPADLSIDWKNMNAEEITALVNACNPWNRGAAATLNNWMLGFTHVTPVAMSTGNALPGTILSVDEQQGLCIACKDNTAIRVDIFYTEEGFLPGWMLARFGIREGMCFTLS